MNPAEPHRLPDDELDTLAAHALDALDADETLAVEAALMGDDGAAAVIAAFRRAAGELAVAADGETEPPAALRSRVLDAALAARPGAPFDVASAPEAHRVEAARLLTTLGRLDDEQWSAPVDPPEFAGWTVHDLVVHVATSEALFAQLLGITTPAAPETANANDVRTAQAQARHRSLAPAVVLAEYEAFADAIDATASAMREADREREVEWWGAPMRVSTVLLHRAFETWIHHDDIRRAVGLPESPPPAATVAAMSRRALSWLPVMLDAGGHDAAGRVARVVLDGDGGGDYLVDLSDGSLLGTDAGAGAGAGSVPDSGAGPGIGSDVTRPSVDVVVRADLIGFCRAIGNRVPAGSLAYEAEGDTALAADLVACLPLLAGL